MSGGLKSGKQQAKVAELNKDLWAEEKAEILQSHLKELRELAIKTADELELLRRLQKQAHKYVSSLVHGKDLLGSDDQITMDLIELCCEYQDRFTEYNKDS